MYLVKTETTNTSMKMYFYYNDKIHHVTTITILLKHLKIL